MSALSKSVRLENRNLQARGVFWFGVIVILASSWAEWSAGVAVGGIAVFLGMLGSWVTAARHASLEDRSETELRHLQEQQRLKRIQAEIEASTNDNPPPPQ